MDSQGETGIIASSPSFRVWTSGPFRLERRMAASSDDYQPVRVIEWGGSNYPRLLLKALLCCPGRRARREALLEMVWPDLDPEQTVHYLNTATSKLRSVLRPAKGQASLLITEDDGSSYKLAGQPLLWVDADAAFAFLQEAERVGRLSQTVIPLLEKAASAFNQGTFLEGEEGLWASGRRATVERARYRCRLWLADVSLQQDMPGQAERILSVLLEEDPLDEDVLCRLIKLLHQQGMMHQATRLYKQTCNVFAREGVEFTAATTLLAANLYKERHTMQRVVTGLPQNTVYPASPQASASLLSSTCEQNSAFSLPTQGAEPSFLSPDAPFQTEETVLLTTSHHQPLESLSTHVQSSSVSSEMVGYFAMVTEICRHLSEGNELKIAEGILWTFLPKIAFIGRSVSEHQQLAAEIASQGYLLAASLVGHRNNLLERLHLSELALRYGEVAGNRNLQVVALRQIAISYDCMRYPDKVLETYQRTFVHLATVSPLLRACVYADVSGAHAQLGQKQEALRFIGIAYDNFPEHPEKEPGYLHTICRYSSLIFWDALNHLLLKQPGEAEKIFEKIDGLYPKIQNPERNRAEVLNYQVETFIALGKMDQACTYLESAVRAAIAVGSVRRFHEASALFQQMCHVWQHERRVQQLARFFVR